MHLSHAFFALLVTAEEWTSLPGAEKWQKQGLIKLFWDHMLKKLLLIFFKNADFFGRQSKKWETEGEQTKK